MSTQVLNFGIFSRSAHCSMMRVDELGTYAIVFLLGQAGVSRLDAWRAVVRD